MNRTPIADDIGDLMSGGLGAVLVANRARLVRFFTSRTGDTGRAEDVVHEIWLHVQRVPSGPVTNPIGYLHRVGLNIVLDRLRAERRRQMRDAAWGDVSMTNVAGEPVEETPSALDALISRDRLARLTAAIAALPPGAGRVFRRLKLDGATHAEVAAELGISKSAIEKHVAVALRHIREVCDD